MNLLSLHEECCKYLLVEKGNTEATIETYKAIFRGFCVWLENEGVPVDISSVGDHEILKRFMYDLADKKLHRNTIKLHMTSLKTFCKYLLRENELERNPFERFDIPRKVKSRAKPLNDQVRDKLVSLTICRALSSNELRDIQAVVMVLLGLTCGLRKKGMRSMMWENTDLVNCETRVIDKGEKEHTYVLSPSAVKWLKVLKSARGVDKGYVLLSPKSNTPISETSLHDEFRRYVELVGLGGMGITLHRLRHTFGTNLLEGTGDLRLVQEALCHEDIGSTVCYTEVAKKKLRENIKRVFSNAK